MNRKIAGSLAIAACIALLGAPSARALTEPTPLVPTTLPEPQQMAPAMPQTADMPPAELVTNGPQSSRGDASARWSPQRNVVESRQYERLLKANPSFRQARIRKECSPIDDSALRQQCVGSFQ